MNRERHKIDADGKILGRLASEIATLLRGKHKVDFQPNIDAGDFVEVKNAGKIKVTGAKLVQKQYHHFSGYPSGLKSFNLENRLAKDPGFVIWHAVRLMLAKNKLRDVILKRLTFVK
ncbi:MAG: 50S ribosomal protein L13 [Patescibacteria group bacterium]